MENYIKHNNCYKPMENYINESQCTGGYDDRGWNI